MANRTSQSKKTNIRFRFKNIGPVRKADLELGDLTVIAGRNNTGKTYIAYALYGFLKMWKSWPQAENFLTARQSLEAQFPDIRKVAEKISQEGLETFTLSTETLIRQRKQVIQELSRAFSRRALPSVFSSQKDDFAKTSINVDIGQNYSNDYQYPEPNLDQKSPLSIKYDGNKVTIVYNRAKTRLSIAALQNLVSYNYFRFLLHDVFPKPFILSAERFGNFSFLPRVRLH